MFCENVIPLIMGFKEYWKTPKKSSDLTGALMIVLFFSFSSSKKK
jgi:hypothetical protein